MTRAKRAEKKRRLPPRRPSATFTAATLLAAFLVSVFFLLPKSLPEFFQRLAGVANAVLAMVVVWFAIREYGHRFNVIRIRNLGRIHTGLILGLLAFFLTLAWWLSPWAPIDAVSA